MFTGRAFLCLLVAPLVPWVTACNSVTNNEARDGFDQTLSASKAMSLEAFVAELMLPTSLATPEEMAVEVTGLLGDRAPCATVTAIDPRRLVVDFPSGCAVGARTMSGRVELSLSRARSGELVVKQEWTALSDGEVTATGTADLTWSSDTSPLHVKHDALFTSKDGVKVEAQGDRTQVRRRQSQVVQSTGLRSWRTDVGLYVLTMREADVRGLLPMPEAGIFQLDTPHELTLTMAFSQLGDGVMVRVFGGHEEHRYGVFGLDKVEELEVQPPR